MATVIHLCGVVAGRAQGAVPSAIVGDRFRIWSGHSGRRHVFTRVESGRDAADLDGAVVLVTRCDRDGSVVAERVLLADDLPVTTAGRELWAHFLAETDYDRRAVMADLAPMPMVSRMEDPTEERARPRAA